MRRFGTRSCGPFVTGRSPMTDRSRVGIGPRLIFSGCLLLAAGKGWTETEAKDEPNAKDWPTIISRLQQEIYARPGFLATRQQLAIAYNNYGVELGKQGQWTQAVQQLQDAIRLDDSNTQFKANLSRIYFNEAQVAYQHHEINEASDALDHAIDLNPDLAQAYTLRGMIEYDRQRLKEAKAAWERAFELDPTQAQLAQRLAQVTKELPVESKFERLSQFSFDLRYEERLERPAGFDVQEALLQARRDVGSDFSCWPQHKIVVLVYSAESFRALRHDTPEWVAGEFDGKIRVPLPDVQLGPAAVRQIAYHEYTHAVIYELTGTKCPTWLNEGLAEYEGQTQKAQSLSHLVKAHQAGRLVPLAKLSDAFARTLSAEEVVLAYEQSYSVVAYLIDRYAFWRIRRLLRALAEGRSFEEALADECRLKPAKLEAAWLEWLPTLLKK